MNRDGSTDDRISGWGEARLPCNCTYTQTQAHNKYTQRCLTLLGGRVARRDNDSKGGTEVAGQEAHTPAAEVQQNQQRMRADVAVVLVACQSPDHVSHAL